MPAIAFDIDLHRIHGYSDHLGRVCYNAPEWPWEVLPSHDLILVEVASPVDTSRGGSRQKRAQAYNRRKWAVGNSVQFGRFVHHCEATGLLPRVRVASADQWTLSYPEEHREIMAGCRGEDNHDIRACRCMLFFHSMNPEKWLSVPQWYAKLSSSKKRK